MSYVPPKFYFVFDVESVGLHGHAIAVGWCVLNAETGEISSPGSVRISSSSVEWTRAFNAAKLSDAQWVRANVIHNISDIKNVVGSGGEMRRTFWTAWEFWKAAGALMAADVAWPVEARFLMQCTLYSGELQDGPYPLIDIASVRLAAGLDPLATEERDHTAGETPAHNPLADARQSARLLREGLLASPWRELPNAGGQTP